MGTVAMTVSDTETLPCGCIVTIKPSEVSVRPCTIGCINHIHIMHGAVRPKGAAEGGADTP